MSRSETKLQTLLVNVAHQLHSSCISSRDNVHHTDGSFASVTPLVQPTTSKLSTTNIRDLSSSCLASAHKLREACIASGRVDYEQDETEDPVWEAAHAQQTRAWADAAFARIRDAVMKANSVSSTNSTDARRPVFNHEYTPLLDKYFEYNAYPSAPDRAVLARKSMMTPRQIEVWFQNHRNRAKKEGKPLRKITETPLPAQLSLDSLERKMPFFTIPAQDRRSNKKKELMKNNFSDEEPLTPSLPPPSSAVDVLDPPGTLHSFPAMYTRRTVDLFATGAITYTFPPPVWFRQPALSSSKPQPCIDMHQLIIEFSQKLHLRAPTSTQHQSKLHTSWCNARITIPSVAPHPALIRSGSDVVVSPLPSLLRPRLTIYPPGFSHALRSTSPQSSSLTPQTRCSQPRRKVARLPKRMLKDNNRCHRHEGPNASDVSPPSSRWCSSSPSSRFPSFGSNVTRRRSSSASSSASSLSSPLTTPPTLPYPLLPDDPFLCSMPTIELGTNDHFNDGTRASMPSVAEAFDHHTCERVEYPHKVYSVALSVDTMLAS